MKFPSRRLVLGLALSLGLLAPAASFAAVKPGSITIDWATYNPVSMLLKDKGWLEEEFAKDGITVTWVQSLGSNKALEFLNAGSIDFGASAGAAALVAKINGNPIKSVYGYSKPEWTALVAGKPYMAAERPLKISSASRSWISSFLSGFDSLKRPQILHLR